MIPDFKKEKKAIYDWAKSELEMEFIWSEQDVHRPDKPYGTIKIIPGFIKIGNSDNITHKLDGVFSLAGVREFTLSLNCYGENAIERANFVSFSIEKPSVIEKLSLAGLVAIKCEQVQNLTTLVDNSFEARAQVDIKFRIAQVIEDNLGIIENVEIKNNINDETLTVIT